MLGVTLSMGGLVSAAAVNLFGLQSDSASAAGSLEVASQGRLVSFVYAAVTPGSGGCASSYQGSTEGTAFAIALYNYGTSPFIPITVFANGTAAPNWSAVPSITLGPNGLAIFSMTLPGCGHPSGQTLTLVDNAGDVVQFVS